MSEQIPFSNEGWRIKVGSQQMIRVVPWVVEEEKKNLHLCLVGSLKSPYAGIRVVVRESLGQDAGQYQVDGSVYGAYSTQLEQGD